jgi:hypothetical protein
MGATTLPPSLRGFGQPFTFRRVWRLRVAQHASDRDRKWQLHRSFASKQRGGVRAPLIHGYRVARQRRDTLSSSTFVKNARPQTELWRSLVWDSCGRFWPLLPIRESANVKAGRISRPQARVGLRSVGRSAKPSALCPPNDLSPSGDRRGVRSRSHDAFGSPRGPGRTVVEAYSNSHRCCGGCARPLGLGDQ